MTNESTNLKTHYVGHQGHIIVPTFYKTWSRIYMERNTILPPHEKVKFKIKYFLKRKSLLLNRRLFHVVEFSPFFIFIKTNRQIQSNQN